VFGEILRTERELHNVVDRYALAVTKDYLFNRVDLTLNIHASNGPVNSGKSMLLRELRVIQVCLSYTLN